MKYIDYREKLGIGFYDEQIFQALLNKIKIGLQIISQELKRKNHNTNFFHLYFITIAESDECPYRYDFDRVINNILISKSMSELIFKCVALINLSIEEWEKSDFKTFFKDYFFQSLDELNILFAETNDDDGIFIFPKGAEELDYALVSEPLEWLTDYPASRGNFITAIKKYSNNDSPNEVADSFRKALERFFQEFFSSSKSIENIVPEYGKYLKEKGIPSEISKNLVKTLELYNSYMNNYVKHHDKAEKDVLEFIMYQTGNIIRLIIVTSKQ